MPTDAKKPLIVISYAHADEPEKPAEGEVKWLSFVTGYLRPAIKHGAVDLWIDRVMPGGADWEREIEAKLRACDVFILLVSRHSLSSDYVIDKEIAIIRERQAKGEAVHFYPLVLTPTPKAGLDLVRDMNLRPRDRKPLSDYPLHERYRHMNEVADEIASIAENLRVLRPVASAVGKSPESWLPILPVNEGNSQGRSMLPVTELGRILTEALKQQPREAGIVTAVRAGLRVLPLAAEHGIGDPRFAAAVPVDAMTSALLRTAAIAWVSGTYPTYTDKLRSAAVAAISALSKSRSGAAHGGGDRAIRFSHATGATLSATLAVDPSSNAPEVALGAAFASVNAVSGLSTALAEVVLNEVLSDVRAIADRGPTYVAGMPLWLSGVPEELSAAWMAVKNGLPRNEDWGVWSD
jgi:TIR domain